MITVLISKWSFMALAWGLALLISYGLRLWGIQHPDPFEIRSGLIFVLLFVPPLIMGLWVIAYGFSSVEET